MKLEWVQVDLTVNHGFGFIRFRYIVLICFNIIFMNKV